MPLARRNRPLIAWMLYLGVLFGAFACAGNHGHLAGLQLSGLGGELCSVEGAVAGFDLDGLGQHLGNPVTADCALASLFGALILAAFFGLLGRLASRRPLIAPVVSPAPGWRDRWPAANPRASPRG